MAIDNELYKAPGDIWWDEEQPLSSLRTAINPCRVGYLRRTLELLAIEPTGRPALDLGCGGGLMAEEVARLGFSVTGIDPAPAAIEVAKAHASESGVRIDYRVATGEALPFADASFDLVYCCDVLEHVSNLERVIEESARVLRPGGIYFFDTINRTRASKLLMIKLFQEWSLTAWMPRNLHDWEKFIRPDELKALLSQQSLHVRDLIGMAPSAAPPKLLVDLLRLRRRSINCGEFGSRSRFREGTDVSVVYAGFAIREVA